MVVTRGPRGGGGMLFRNITKNWHNKILPPLGPTPLGLLVMAKFGWNWNYISAPKIAATVTSSESTDY
jgi:hypothetical protein